MAPATDTVGGAEPASIMNSSAEGTKRDPVTITGVWIGVETTIGVVTLRLVLVQSTVHTPLAQLALSVVGQSGGGPEQVDSKGVGETLGVNEPKKLDAGEDETDERAEGGDDPESVIDADDVAAVEGVVDTDDIGAEEGSIDADNDTVNEEEGKASDLSQRPSQTVPL